METKKVSTLCSKLNNVCNLLDSLYNINSGGCCFVAYCLFKMLKHDFNNVDLLVFSDFDLEDYTSFKNIHESQAHYAIKLHDKIINASNYNQEYYCVHTYHNINTNLLLRHYNKFSWNPIYDKKNNKIVRKILNNFYDDFKKDLY